MVRQPQVSCKSEVFSKPGRQGPPEDVVGFSNNTAWIMDGATPPQTETSAKDTQKFLSYMTDQINAEFAKQKQDIRQSVRNCIANIADELWYKNLDYKPYAAFAAVRFGLDRVEYFVLSDVTLIINNGSETKIISDSRIDKCASELRSAVRELSAAGVSEISPEYLNLRRALIAEERNFLNKVGGYWVLSNCIEAADRALHGYIEYSREKSNRCYSLGMSDGFARLTSHLRFPIEISYLYNMIETHGAKYLIDRLRYDEEHYASKLALSSSRHDDAGYFLCRYP